jgi:hypothetical protein
MARPEVSSGGVSVWWESGVGRGRFFVCAFGRYLASVDVKKFPKKCYTYCSFKAIYKDNAAINSELYDRGIKHIRNVGELLPDYKAQHPRR